MNLIVIENFSEAVDPKARNNRLLKLWRLGSKKANQSDRMYSKSIGYRKDLSAAPLSTGSHPVKKGLHSFRGNRKAASSLSDYAKAKAGKARAIFHKFANKQDEKSGSANKPYFDYHSKRASSIIGSRKKIAKHTFKNRRNYDAKPY